MTALQDQVRAKDGRVLAIRCRRCRLLFANVGPGMAQRHADHTWTHVTAPTAGRLARMAATDRSCSRSS